MGTFQVGDTVKCIDDGGVDDKYAVCCVIKGRSYEVTKIVGNRVWVKGLSSWFHDYRFELVSRIEHSPPNTVVQPSDNTLQEAIARIDLEIEKLQQAKSVLKGLKR